ncbi:MAG: hypothetical protein B7C24_10835, partial [Bacteroidetes bacterium 4572_77]
PENDNAAGFSYTAQSGESFVGEIDPFMVFPPEEGEVTGDPDPNGNGNYSVYKTPGGFNVSPTGAATYTIPIKLPQGINGMMPNLAITYNSQAGDGLLGFGWNLTGLSAISRIGNDWYHDGNIDPIDFTDDDKFALDGNRLILATGVYGSNSSEYTTEIYSGSRITAYADGNQSPGFFIVETNTGQILKYGESEYSRTAYDIGSGEYVKDWLLSSIEDTYGNKMEFYYEYSGKQPYLSTILYGPITMNTPFIHGRFFEVNFYYGDKRNKKRKYFRGEIIHDRKVLSEISTTIGRYGDITSYFFKYYNATYKNYNQTFLKSYNMMSYNWDLNDVTYSVSMPIKFDWAWETNQLTLNKTQLPSQNPNYESEYHQCNINNDGLADLIELQYYVADYNNTPKYKVYIDMYYRLNTGNGFGPLQLLDSNPPEYIKKLLIDDYNGDGKDDIAIVHWDNQWHDDKTILQNIYLSNQNNSYSLNNSNYTDFGQEDFGQFLAGDFDGDFESEIIKIQKKPGTGNNVWAFDINDYGLLDDCFWGSYDFGKSPSTSIIRVGNFIHYNKSSLLVMKVNNINNLVGTVISLFSDKEDYHTKVTCHFGYSSELDFSKDLFLGDFNGDNLTDLFFKSDDFNKWKIYVNTDDSWKEWRAPFGWIEPDFPNINISDNHFVAVGDYDGNKVSDLLHIYKESPLDATADYCLYMGNGNEFTKVEGMIDQLGSLLPNDITGQVTSMFKSGVSPSDFNGDGKSDIFMYENLDYNGSQVANIFHINYDNNEYCLTEISSLGQKYQLDFSSSVLNNYEAGYGLVYETNNNLLNYNVPIPRCIQLRDYFSDSYNTITYNYSEAIYSINTSKFLGFSVFETNEDLFQTKSKQTFEPFFDNFFFFNTKTENWVAISGNDKTTSISESIWEIKNISVLGNANSLLPYSEKTNIKAFDPITSQCLSTTRKVQEYNNNGNLVTVLELNDPEEINIEMQNESFDYSKTTVSTYYGPEDLPWCRNLPDIHTVTLSSPNEDDIVKQINTDYYALDIVSIIRKNEGDLLEVETQFFYDGMGRIIKEVTSTPNYDMPERVMQYFYGDNNDEIYLTKTINALGHTTKIVERNLIGWPMVTEKIMVENQPGLKTTFKYDDFANIIETIAPSGIVHKNGIRWTDENETEFPDAVYFTWSNSSGNQMTYKYFDYFGNIVGAKSFDINDNPVYSKIKYDDKGRKEYSYSPKIGDNENIIRYQYDILNRLSRVDVNLTVEGTTSDKYTRYEYENLTSEKYYNSSNGELKTKTIKNSRGLTEFIYDEDNKPIEYKYFSNGALKESTVFGSSSSFTYDINGNRNSMLDPSLGTITYEYNPYNELVEKVDNKNQETENVFTYQYDILGRLEESKDYENNIIKHIYDEKGDGLISYSELITNGSEDSDYLNQKIEYFYDDLYRVNAVANTVNSVTYAFNYEFDELGRTKYITYPTGLKIRNKYNSNGYLLKIEDVIDGHSLWETTTDGYDKLGRLTDYTVNKDVGAITTSKIYDPQTGYLTDIETSNNNLQIQDWHYAYYSDGNMKSRSQANSAGLLSEIFHYDELNRLDDVTSYLNGNNPYEIDYHFESNGNIGSISTVGDFEYNNSDNAGPYRISGVDFYDDNDIPNPQSIGYTAFDKVKSLTETGIGSLYIRYGIDKERLYQKEILDEGIIKEKYFIGGLYEKEVSDGVIKELCYVSTPAGTVAVKQTENNNDNWYFLTHDHLGSIHCILNEDGSLAQELGFDPFGNRRDPLTWKPIADGEEQEYIFDRGFTMHEHWDDFTLINMNGRVYDPVISRFLSPDPYIQAPSYTQNFNRYSYVLNNPLRYSDPDGEFIVPMLIGAGIGVLTNGISNSIQDKPFFSGTGRAAILGGIGGAMSFGIGQAAVGLSGISQVGFQTLAHGSLGGVMSQMNGGTFGQGFVSGASGSLIGWGTSSLLQNSGLGLQAIGTVTSGGLAGGVGAEIMGGDFWDGVRNGTISAGLNHAIHSGVFSKGLMMASITGRGRHFFGPDAEGYEIGNIDMVAVAGVDVTTDGEWSKVTMLRGPNKGEVYDMTDVGFGVGLDIGMSTVISEYYYTGSASSFTYNTFNGSRIAVQVGASYWVEGGVGLSIAKTNGEYLIGLSYHVGISPPGFSGNTNWGKTYVK